MSEPKNNNRSLERLISDTFKEVVALRTSTLNWVKTEHALKDTEARIEEFEQLGTDIAAIAEKLNERVLLAQGEKIEVTADLKIFEFLRGYEKQIEDILKKDLEEKKKEKSDTKVDVVKNVAFFIGTPAAFVAGVKNGVGSGHIDVNEAFVLGIAVAVPTVFHKKAVSLFKKVSQAICSAPHGLQAIPALVSSDMRVVYVREIVKEKINSAQICFKTAGKSINDNAGVTRTGIQNKVRKLFRREGPRC